MNTYWKYTFKNSKIYEIYERDEIRKTERRRYNSNYNFNLDDPAKSWTPWDHYTIEDELSSWTEYSSIVELTDDEVFLEMV